MGAYPVSVHHILNVTSLAFAVGMLFFFYLGVWKHQGKRLLPVFVFFASVIGAISYYAELCGVGTHAAAGGHLLFYTRYAVAAEFIGANVVSHYKWGWFALAVVFTFMAVEQIVRVMQDTATSEQLKVLCPLLLIAYLAYPIKWCVVLRAVAALPPPPRSAPLLSWTSCLALDSASTCFSTAMSWKMPTPPCWPTTRLSSCNLCCTLILLVKSIEFSK